MDGSTLPRRSRTGIALAALLLIALALKVLAWPARSELRDPDEVGYLLSGLAFWEGMPAGYSASPAGPQHWLAWLAGAWSTGIDAIPRMGREPVVTAAAGAADSALFSLHEDLSILRNIQLMLTAALGLGAVAAAFALGRARGGDAGGLAAGLLVAALPPLVEHSAMARPYADAWHLGLLALAAAGSRRCGAVAAGVALGLAVACRVDMILLAPAVAGLCAESAPAGGRVGATIRAGAAAAITMLIAAPWCVARLAGCLRIVALSGIDGAAATSRAQQWHEIVFTSGMGPLMLVALLAPLARAVPRSLAAWSVALLLLLLLGSPQPLRYSGAALVAATAAAAWALSSAVGSGSAPLRAAALLVVALPASCGLRLALRMRAAGHDDGSTAWIERHVAPGTTVLLQEPWQVRPPLPTPQSAERAWLEVTEPAAFARKFTGSAVRRGWAAGPPTSGIPAGDGAGTRAFASPACEAPRAFSEELLALDRTWARRWWILGGGETSRPRYDVRRTGMSRTFGVQDAVSELLAGGGVLVWREGPLPQLGEPDAIWGDPRAAAVRVWVRPAPGSVSRR